MQYILFVGYSTVGLDGEIFERFLTLFSCVIPASPPPTEPISVDIYNPTYFVSAVNANVSAFMLRGVSGNAPKNFTMDHKIHRETDHTSVDPSLSGNGAQGS